MSTARPTVFAWITGQQTNIGDSLLRRPYLRLLSRLGVVDVWVRDASDEFITGLDVPSTARISRSFIAWWTRALMSSLRRPTTVAINAGEAPDGRGAVVAAFALTLLSRIARARGGFSLWLGGSVPAGRSVSAKRAYSALASSTSVLSWREPVSQRSSGRGRIQPDWAFTEASASVQPDGPARTTLAIVLRGDRTAPSEEWLRWVRTLISDHKLTVTTVVQVEQDHERAHEIARALGGSCVEWPPGASHAEQEARVRDLYRGCRVVIGDRLHGLVVAATEGAIPLGWVPSSGGKIDAHFAPLGLTWVSEHEGSPAEHLPTVTPDDLDDYTRQVSKAIGQARVTLSSLSDEIVHLVAHRSSDGEDRP